VASLVRPAGFTIRTLNGKAGKTQPWRHPVLPLAALLAAGALLRFWQLGNKPDWQYDEGVYYRIAQNVALHGTLNEHISYGAIWTPYLFHPPFYFLLLAGWFDLFGSGIAQARVLGVLSSLIMLAVLFRLLWKLYGPQAALFATTLITFDAWITYVQRVSYMENILELIIVTGLLLYQRALERPSWQRFLLAGLALGMAAVFKETGVYILVAAGIYCLITRREYWGHQIFYWSAASVIGLYVLFMIRDFSYGGHVWFLQDMAIQVRRTFGLRSSGGTLTSAGSFVHLIEHQYAVFIPSLLAMLGGVVIVVRDIARCIRTRSWRPLAGKELLFSWAMAGLLIFGISSLKFPQYFSLVLIPLYCLLWVELYGWLRAALPAIAVAALVTLVGIGSFSLRVLMRHDNAFAQVQRYAADHIPRDQVVITEDSIGNLIQQPWCRVEALNPCGKAAAYAITWKTYLQSSFALGGREFSSLMKGATRIASFPGFSGTATVWRLK
jgi:4-amino-4-deoxy-L-arabinose transferase-like glycosyltransferase